MSEKLILTALALLFAIPAGLILYGLAGLMVTEPAVVIGLLALVIAIVALGEK